MCIIKPFLEDIAQAKLAVQPFRGDHNGHNFINDFIVIAWLGGNTQYVIHLLYLPG